MDNKIEEIIKSLDPSSLREDAGRFSAKLNFAERCSILAAYMSGVNRRLLSVAFGINRRTITHIYNAHSPHYKEVRAEAERLGREEFIRTYLTEDVAMKLKESERDKKAQILMGLNDKEESKLAHHLAKPSPRKNRDEGYHVLHPEHCQYSHRVHIMWADGYFGEGWYFKDLDGAFPTEWMHSGEDSILSSTTALSGAKIEVQDKI